jgi:hypothetical protein
MAHKREAFAPVFYRRHRNHIFRVYVKIVLWLACIGALAVVGVLAYFEEGRFPFLAAFFAAAFLYFLVASFLSGRDMFRVRLLPYFSKRLGHTSPFLEGTSLLWHTRQLDDIAAKLGARPLSDFASGDDMILGERLRWFDAQPALETVSRLQECPEAAAFPAELKSDLKCLREALASACLKQIQFCLLLREGSFASGLEMDRRKGSFS